MTVTAVGDRARLAVADEGPGLPPAQAEAAFERFWRGPGAARPGSGLGLAIVRATARAHGGDVAIAGATFTLDLPLAGAPGSIVRDPSEPGRTVPDPPSTPDP